ncbi:calcium-binding protein [Pararhizobium arenae]|uniref:calcium-binding protein n=1 Tax=Pararhizobium arenae TaxID=1856850 RepID=UPI0009F955BE|nr:calcium-binding protein [Pararhizobium arenae]
MALRAFVSSISGTGVQGILAAGDDGFVAEGVTVASTDDVGITASGSGHLIDVYGTVLGDFRAIFMGGSSTTDFDNTLYVAETGHLAGYDTGAFSVRLDGNRSTLINEGRIDGKKYAAIAIGGSDATTQSTVENSGVIEGKTYAVFVNASEAFKLTNTGIIKGGVSGGTGQDVVLNNGTMIGDVNLEDGADTFDTRGGSYTGVANGGLGADKLYAGAGNNTLAGGEGNDVLAGGAGADSLDGGADTDSASYFYSSAGVTVSLTTPSANKGDAAGDTFISIENISGSAFNDTLAGNSAANTIFGNSGNDVIKGYAGNDTLTGASGKDTFLFHTALNAATNADKITDFSAIDDTIQLENAIFTALASTGTLSADAFRANGTGLAADSTDRIVYETDTGKLFYDRDGSGVSFDGVLFATLTNKPTITNADFIIV